MTIEEYQEATERLMDPLEVYERYGHIDEDEVYTPAQRDDVMDILETIARLHVIYANLALRHQNHFSDLQMEAHNKLATAAFTLIEGCYLWDMAQSKDFRQEGIQRKLSRKALGIIE